MLALLRPLLQVRSYLLDGSKSISWANKMSSRKFIWTVKQLLFYPQFSYLKIPENSQDFAKKWHFHKNYCMLGIFFNCFKKSGQSIRAITRKKSDLTTFLIFSDPFEKRHEKSWKIFFNFLTCFLQSVILSQNTHV